MSFIMGPRDLIKKCVFGTQTTTSRTANDGLYPLFTGGAAGLCISSIFLDFERNKQLVKKIKEVSEFINVNNDISPSSENREIHLSDYLNFVSALAEVMRLYYELIKKDCDDIEKTFSIFKHIDIFRVGEISKLGGGGGSVGRF